MNTSTTHNSTPGAPAADIDKRRVVLLFLLVVLLPLLLFVTAGRVDWWQGWVYTILMTASTLISRLILFLKNPALMQERVRFTESEGIKEWDKSLVVLIALGMPVLFMLVAGLDKRYGWSPDVVLWLQLVSILIIVLGWSLATWALLVNAFFSSVVRIQTDRGHTVATSGPYRFVRHPAYIGGIVAWLVSPLLVGSLWAYIPAGTIVVLYIVRTALEDRTLQAELPGYEDYAQRVRYRLLPGVW
ncbi:MAG: isoprenylcysteine carboxylmethyltransferase family protein [Anaerolineae bacterium]|nr:isoprenylcysteine carboxylmethyltransferase family protein [Anaerolineae bacterium]